MKKVRAQPAARKPDAANEKDGPKKEAAAAAPTNKDADSKAAYTAALREAYADTLSRSRTRKRDELRP